MYCGLGSSCRFYTLCGTFGARLKRMAAPPSLYLLLLLICRAECQNTSYAHSHRGLTIFQQLKDFNPSLKSHRKTKPRPHPRNASPARHLTLLWQRATTMLAFPSSCQPLGCPTGRSSAELCSEARWKSPMEICPSEKLRPWMMGKRKKSPCPRRHGSRSLKLPWPSSPLARFTVLVLPSPSLSSLKFLRQMRSEWHFTTCSWIPAKSPCASGVNACKKTLTELPLGNGSRTKQQKKQREKISSLRASDASTLAWVKTAGGHIFKTV